MCIFHDFFWTCSTAKNFCSPERNECLNSENYKLCSSGISDFHLVENGFIANDFFFSFSAELIAALMYSQHF